MKWRRFVSVPIFSVFLLIVFVYYVTIFIFLDNWLGFQSSAGLLNVLIFSSLGSLSFFSFLVCVLTDPGGLPPAYVPDMEENDVSDQEPKKSVSFLLLVLFIVCLKQIISMCPVSLFGWCCNISYWMWNQLGILCMMLRNFLTCMLLLCFNGGKVSLDIRSVVS